MEVDDPGFKSVILDILNRWTALKMVVDHHMGGRLSYLKALYLADDINEIFRSNQAVETEDLEDFITGYMDTECNTVLEDNSPLEVSRTLVRLFEVFSKNGASAVEAELRTLPPVAEWLKPGLSPANKDDEDDDESESESESCVSDECEDEPMEAVEEDIGWTKVTYGKKR